jgi:hypothetical protein
MTVAAPLHMNSLQPPILLYAKWNWMTSTKSLPVRSRRITVCLPGDSCQA